MPSFSTTCHNRHSRSLRSLSSASWSPGPSPSSQPRSNHQQSLLSTLLRLPSPLILLLISSICCYTFPFQVEASILAALAIAAANSKHNAAAKAIPGINAHANVNRTDGTSTLRKPALTMPDAVPKSVYSTKTMEAEVPATNTPVPIPIPIMSSPSAKEQPKYTTQQREAPTVELAHPAPVVAAPPRAPVAEIPKPAIGVSAGNGESEPAVAPVGAHPSSHFISQINLQTFDGSLGGIFAPSISSGGASGLEFRVNNQIFVSFPKPLVFKECFSDYMLFYNSQVSMRRFSNLVAFNLMIVPRGQQSRVVHP
jgi:hypothetical protein